MQTPVLGQVPPSRPAALKMASLASKLGFLVGHSGHFLLSIASLYHVIH